VAGATINGTNQGQTLTGMGEEDFIYGLGGNDTLQGLAGSDYLDGGAGTDTATYATSPAAISVSLATGIANGGDAAGDTLLNIENLTGSTFNDTLEGDAGNNVLAGGPGTDTVSYEHATAGVTVNLSQTRGQNTEGAGTDKLSGFENLTGSAFNDMLTGSPAANTLIGLDGDDVLIGGDGADTLTGGIGADRFVFTGTSNSSPNAPDIITDFMHGTDIIDLSAIDANSSPKAKGDQPFTFSGLNSDVVANSVTWSESGGNTIIRADVTGNSAADFMLVLTGTNHNLTGSDFNL